MRIISGSLKGTRINPPKSFKARPTTDLAKESLFNILQNRFDLDGVDVLDLFSGTGGISYEFASRGASRVDAVEIENAHASFIKKMVAEHQLRQVRVVRNDAFKFLSICIANYDLIFADPPYSTKKLEQIPLIVAQRGLLKPGGLLILEHSSQNDFSSIETFAECRSYGGVNFSFFG